MRTHKASLALLEAKQWQIFFTECPGHWQVILKKQRHTRKSTWIKILTEYPEILKPNLRLTPNLASNISSTTRRSLQQGQNKATTSRVRKGNQSARASTKGQILASVRVRRFSKPVFIRVHLVLRPVGSYILAIFCYFLNPTKCPPLAA